MSVRRALAKLSAAAAGSALAVDGAVHVAEPQADSVSYKSDKDQERAAPELTYVKDGRLAAKSRAAKRAASTALWRQNRSRFRCRCPRFPGRRAHPCAAAVVASRSSSVVRAVPVRPRAAPLLRAVRPRRAAAPVRLLARARAARPLRRPRAAPPPPVALRCLRRACCCCSVPVRPQSSRAAAAARMAKPRIATRPEANTD